MAQSGVGKQEIAQVVCLRCYRQARRKLNQEMSDLLGCGVTIVTPSAVCHVQPGLLSKCWAEMAVPLSCSGRVLLLAGHIVGTTMQLKITCWAWAAVQTSMCLLLAP